ncbi:hypothetical protein [Haloarcula pellucida]|uniref:hypothetical protein n=1 Tax=Haloarcula pellucida TaxID=1427151 RepID=UPI00166ADA86|nr:hypothetical protein [Halomicroarcula pellucida]MBX0350477.1 hypothetical protein [Halomicroarcula pellucida]
MDVVRRFNPQITQSNLESSSSNPEEALIGHKDVDKISARIEGVEAKWNRSARPMRPVRIGSRDAPVYLSAKGAGFPVHAYLDEQNILPLDPNEGDFIERRTGRDTWTDITTREGQAWVADYRMGKLTIFRLPGHGSLPVLRNYRERFVRLSYRLGVGGEYGTAGQTTLTSQLAQGSTTTIGVDDASRLPPSGGVMLVDGAEYVDVASVDHSADEITIRARGVRATSDADRASGSTVHYCPMDVREAVAAKAAEELVRFDDWTDELVDGGRAVQAERKLDDWESEWTNTIAQYSDNYGYQ